MSGDPLNVIGRGSPAEAFLDANRPKASDTYGNTRADRYRRPGWSDLAELYHEAKRSGRLTSRRRTSRVGESHTRGTPLLPKAPRAGRPPGGVTARDLIIATYRHLRAEEGRRPSWAAVAGKLFVCDRTLRRDRYRFGLTDRDFE